MAVPSHTVSQRLETSRRTRVSGFLEENGTLVVVLGAFAIAMLAYLRGGLVADGWMALVSGREIVAHGLPSHETLTLWAHGRRWVHGSTLLFRIFDRRCSRRMHVETETRPLFLKLLVRLPPLCGRCPA